MHRKTSNATVSSLPRFPVAFALVQSFSHLPTPTRVSCISMENLASSMARICTRARGRCLSVDERSRYVMASSFFERRGFLLLFQPNILTTITMKRPASECSSSSGGGGGSGDDGTSRSQFTSRLEHGPGAKKVNTTNYNSGKFKINGGL